MSTDELCVCGHGSVIPGHVTTQLRCAFNDEFSAVILVSIELRGAFVDDSGTGNGAN